MDKNTEREIREKLQAEEKKRSLNKHFGENHNKYVEAAIIFFGTLGPLYLLYFIAYRAFMFTVGAAGSATQSISIQLPFPWLIPFIHAAIWSASIYSVYRKRSVLDDLYRRL
jgi:hypothetical protein